MNSKDLPKDYVKSIEIFHEMLRKRCEERHDTKNEAYLSWRFGCPTCDMRIYCFVPPTEKQIHTIHCAIALLHDDPSIFEDKPEEPKD